jgi:DNA-binding beta-propeller fold protein YncE
MKLRSLAVLVSAVAMIGLPQAVGAAPRSQVAQTAPENFRCPGQPFPPLPGEGWQILPVWEWRDVVNVEGVIGSNDGPYAVALDRACNIYLTDSQHYQVLKLHPDGSVAERWSMAADRMPGESSSPRGVAVDTRGNVYVTDTPRDRVYKLSPQGQVLAVWGVCETPSEANKYCDSTQPGRFQAPEGIAVDGLDNVYVSESAGNRIQKLSSDGQPRAIWNLKGRGLGDFFILGSLAVDQGGYVYVSDGYNDQVLKFDPNNGNVVGKWGSPGREPGQFDLPLGVGVDAEGNVFVAESDNWRVQKLAPDGSFLANWRLCLDGDPPCALPDAGQGPGEFMAARGITIDGQGTVYVADTGNKRLQRLMIVDFVLIPPPPPDEEA